MRRRFIVIAALLAALLGQPLAAPAPAWVVDPNDPGPDLPPHGRSLFDWLFSGTASSYDVPFPFTELLQRLEARLPRLPGGGSSLKKVLIPLGRSLQRNAAAPDFFAHPRVVVAVDSEPDETLRHPFYLKDRLYIGYQQSAEVLEVISYNEQAARFEFQVVDDYGAGRTPRVRYANRALCTSCHQNGGPIFSKPGWEETNSDPRIAARLAEIGAMFHGVPARRSSVDAAAIDNATDRANLLSAYQLLWREGCGGAGLAAARCRGAALVAMLQLRASGFSHFAEDAPAYRNDYAAALQANWLKRWPHGLAIPDPDIPNRAPPFLTRTADVPHEFDPLNPRPPLAVWKADATLGARRLVEGLALELPAVDLRRLDAVLSADRAAPRRRFRGPCTFARSGMLRAEQLLRVSCRTRDTHGGELALHAELAVTAERSLQGVIDSLTLGDGTGFGALLLQSAPIASRGSQRAVSAPLRQQRSGARVRLGDGHALAGLHLTWEAPGEAPLPASEAFAGTATLTVIEDFAPVTAAVQRLAARGDAGALGTRPFHGPTVTQALLRELGAAPTEWCCALPPALPPPQVQSQAPGEPPIDPRLEQDLALRTFFQYCGTCHRGNGRLPPGFLRGARERVQRSLKQCAARIYYRLSMWPRAPAERAKSPMPPPQSLPAGGWAQSSELAILRRHALESLPGVSGEALLARPYEELPACLPERG